MKFVYTLTPKAGLEPVVNMLVESDAILGMLKDDRFYRSRGSIMSYSVDVINKKMEVTLSEQMYGDIYNSLNRIWTIKENALK